MARHERSLKLGLKPIQLYVRLNLRPLGQQAYHVWLREILRYYVVTVAAVGLHEQILALNKLQWIGMPQNPINQPTYIIILII